MKTILDIQDIAVIDAILLRNGIERQTLQLGEEMSELYVAISHRLRGRTPNNDEVAEEVADVLFMLSQMVRYFNLDLSQIDDIINRKRNRMIERLQRGS